jgi:hypothetical protein
VVVGVVVVVVVAASRALQQWRAGAGAGETALQ